MPRDENDREPDAPVGELALEIEAAAVWQPDVEYEAGWTVRAARLKKFIDRSHCFGPKADRSDKAGNRIPNAWIIVNDDYGRGACRRGRLRWRTHEIP